MYWSCHENSLAIRFATFANPNCSLIKVFHEPSPIGSSAHELPIARRKQCKLP